MTKYRNQFVKTLPAFGIAFCVGVLAACLIERNFVRDEIIVTIERLHSAIKTKDTSIIDSLVAETVERRISNNTQTILGRELFADALHTDMSIRELSISINDVSFAYNMAAVDFEMYAEAAISGGDKVSHTGKYRYTFARQDNTWRLIKVETDNP